MLLEKLKTYLNPTKVFRNHLLLQSKSFQSSVRTSKSMQSKEIAPTQVASFDNELCLLVDEKDVVIGSATKRECHMVRSDGSLPLHRAFSVLLFNSAGKLLVQKRASEKVTFPNTFTNTCCSHPLLINNQPEDVKTAAIRRLNTELGISSDQINCKDLTLVNRFIYFDAGDDGWGEHELDHVMILKSDVDVHPNPHEVAEVLFVSKENFDSFMANLKDPVTPWFKLMYHHMLRYWWDNLHRLEEIAEPQTIYSFKDKEIN